MPTFLVTSRMNPALAARVEASVTGRRPRAARASNLRRLVALARVLLVLTLGLAVYAAITIRRAAQRDVERTRAELLEAVRASGETLNAEDRASLARVESWLARLSGAYEGDVLGGLEPLSRPMVYVRGGITSFATHDRIADAAATSYKDALLLCLVEPPKTRLEPELVAKVHLARAGGAVMEDRTPNVRRLHDLEAGLPFLLPPWSERVRAAEDAADLSRLKKDLARAPLARAKQAARARLLLAAMDEPGEGATELDGERPHHVRLALVDLAEDRVLFRVRRRVDPKWITPAKRPTHATDLDGCALAFDVASASRASTSSWRDAGGIDSGGQK